MPGPPPTVTATVNSTRFVTREHMLAAGEMQISGEPFAEAMGRDLGNYSRDHLPTDIYFDTSALAAGPWIDLPGLLDRRRVVRVLEAADEQRRVRVGRGHVARLRPARQRRRRGRRRGDREAAAMRAALRHGQQRARPLRVRAGTFPIGNASGDSNPIGAGAGARTRSAGRASGRRSTCSRASIRRSIRRATSTLACAISSDDDPGASGALGCADYECDASTLHLRDRASQIDPMITPGADGFSAWKYGLWVLNYLQVMHDSTEAAVATSTIGDLANVGSAGNRSSATTAPARRPRRARSWARATSKAFRRRCSSTMLDNRAADWLVVADDDRWHDARRASRRSWTRTHTGTARRCAGSPARSP